MPSEVKGQTDFSAGEIDVAAKRDAKNPLVMAGVRNGSNFRILNTKGMQNRSGRRALFRGSVRTEEVLMAPGVTYYLNFSNGNIDILNSSGVSALSEGRPWSTTTAKNVVWAVYDKSIYVTFAGMTPRVYTWDGVTTWTAADFVEQQIGNQKRTPFYRLAPKGITLTPAAATGAGVGITFSATWPGWAAGLVGSRLRYQGRQMVVASVTGPTTGTVNISEALQGAQTLSFVANPFVAGDVLSQPSTGATGVVTLIAGLNATVTLLSTISFVNDGTHVSNGSANSIITGAVNAAPPASVIWDQEVMNSFVGWPASVFVDQNRLGFCDFPSLPGAIAWSAVGGSLNDFYPDAFASDGLSTDSIFELVPGKRRVLYVIAGMDASEFVFCDVGLLYIQITPTNPLRPGSVGFNTISEDECGQVQPRRAGEFIVYASGGVNQLMVVRIFGAYTRAYKTDSLTELSAHLFTSIQAIAIMTASGSFAERYLFALNADGSVISGKYSLSKNGELEGNVGWTPWSSGTGTAKWVSCRGSNILFTTSYAPNGIGAVQLVELLDDSRYLDASQLYNTQPAGLPIPGGKGPLWYLAGGTVDLMDGPLGTRMMGTYVIDANGFLVPQNNGGEDFTSVNLVVGQAWTATLEPFIPPAQAGQDVQQRMKKRRIMRAQVNVLNSSGFVMQRLYSGQSGPQLPAYGTVMAQRRIPTWNVGEDPTQPPTLREESYIHRPVGRSPDPRWSVLKDTPGPLTIADLTLEVTV